MPAGNWPRPSRTARWVEVVVPLQWTRPTGNPVPADMPGLRYVLGIAGNRMLDELDERGWDWGGRDLARIATASQFGGDLYPYLPERERSHPADWLTYAVYTVPASQHYEVRHIIPRPLPA